ncbi:DUF397 domain-containing protein [Nonomuraea sp. NPDC050536]|uniref:DUF397 domain-containing protein n=1 Tax=Nonomuraea sp. NPDC050536 TaxID=3364366 RepID=UPI0037CCA68A
MWRRSSRCNGSSACVEVAYRKSSVSGGAGECVEAGLCPHEDEVWVRDSKHPDGPVLRFSVADWRAFLDAVKTGNVATYSGAVQVATGRDGGWVVCHRDEPDTALAFTPREVKAFVEGVEDGEFDLAELASDAKAPGDRPGSTLAGSGVEKASV